VFSSSEVRCKMGKSAKEALFVVIHHKSVVSKMLHMPIWHNLFYRRIQKNSTCRPTPTLKCQQSVPVGIPLYKFSL
jgi:hypothetical protein